MKVTQAKFMALCLQCREQGEFRGPELREDWIRDHEDRTGHHLQITRWIDAR